MIRLGIAPGVKVQNPVNIRGVAKSAQFKLQGGKVFYIIYFKLQHFTVRKMIEQGLYF